MPEDNTIELLNLFLYVRSFKAYSNAYYGNSI